ncbi:rRNA maturation RNase YbeY [Roseicyclus sp. F158]|uniref:Endoribonuclease YbeY n=1 Tax=Tropicimonas omnivorans TaxID=3075590 RepID=A0ABU3DG78_9RHOB|nr:rRNA maturation RNase YbeY [Roseicyclus sp. F158]MDT0682152.1 rRNA maturation RNase YbeY [Roseicyclus sp. F158]
MGVDLVTEAEDWSVLPLEELAERALAGVTAELGLPGDVEISLLACSDDRIAVLNGEFRDKPKATNVLSWPAEDLAPDTPGEPPLPLPPPDFPGEPPFLGDIALAFETCAAEAEAGGKPLGSHVMHLLVHGILHLLGYDHVTDSDAVLMESTEVRILGQLGEPDPYGSESASPTGRYLE